MSDAIWGYGVKLKRGNGADPEVFTEIAEVIGDVSFTSSRDEIDLTSRQSADGYREKIGGFRDFTVSFEANHIPTNATQDESTGVLEGFNSNANENFRIVYPDSAGYYSLTGFLSSHEVTVPLEAQATLSCEIVGSGKPTWTDGAEA